MVAKTPDYVIADCGCPQWNTNRKEIDFDTLEHFAISMDKNKRLLPRRETITDYYVRALADKLNAWKTVASAKQRETLYQLNKRYDDPSIVKHMKTQRNEATRRQQQSHYSHTNSKPHISDKRRRSRTPATTTTTIAVTANTTLDSDLDVF